ncbi:MAG: hypothetical protein GX978_04515 [Tissierellia bacterium]|jgi:hypothetical protein|nr:hypothetical protein [Tissierellia bacterium]
MKEVRELIVHLGQYESVYQLGPEIPDNKLSEVIAKLKQIGENNSVSVRRPGERENGFYGGTGIDRLDKERYDTFLAQANQLVERYTSGRSMKVVDETIIKPVYRGNMLLGIVGAILGGLLGAVLFATVAYFGFFISYLGFVIAMFAAKGYDMLGGQQGPNKKIILIVVIFLSVVAGFLFANAALFSQSFNGNLIEGLKTAWFFMINNPTSFFNLRFLIGLVFAYLGAMNVLRARY